MIHLIIMQQTIFYKLGHEDRMIMIVLSYAARDFNIIDPARMTGDADECGSIYCIIIDDFTAAMHLSSHQYATKAKRSPDQINSSGGYRSTR